MARCHWHAQTLQSGDQTITCHDCHPAVGRHVTYRIVEVSEGWECATNFISYYTYSWFERHVFTHGNATCLGKSPNSDVAGKLCKSLWVDQTPSRSCWCLSCQHYMCSIAFSCFVSYPHPVLDSGGYFQNYVNTLFWSTLAIVKQNEGKGFTVKPHQLQLTSPCRLAPSLPAFRLLVSLAAWCNKAW